MPTGTAPASCRPAAFRAVAGLLLVLAVLAGAGPVRAAQTGDLDRLRALALDLVNGERRARGLPPFGLRPALNEAAQAHAEDMLRRGYYSHVSPEGRTVMDRYTDAGGSRWRLVEENIARCATCAPPPGAENVRRLHAGWMESAGHRENILNPGVDGFGFGIVAGEDGGLYAVQTFAGPGAPRGNGNGAGQAATALPPAERAPRALEIVNAARREAGVAPLLPSAPLTGAARDRLAATGNGAAGANGGPLASLRGEGRAAWRSAALIAGRCGGCGTRPTAADIRFFVDSWLKQPAYRGTLLDPDATHLGFAIAADGEGAKRAAAVLGRAR